ncbi:hypothetical protein AQUCO_04200073v1 [Aquilegia coerulea]|uniref:G domain-containing protein n=1 Tax=Aquilegia coerulea TaxID=218851 RepID=A0A2G5CP49_AQUCA|nr:hypothetical protein AQUCO_04200073v1 [Aquilegia coerulea]
MSRVSVLVAVFDIGWGFGGIPIQTDHLVPSKLLISYCFFLINSYASPSISFLPVTTLTLVFTITCPGMPPYWLRPLLTTTRYCASTHILPNSLTTHLLYSISFQYRDIGTFPALANGSSMHHNFFSIKAERTKLGGYCSSINHPWRCLNHFSFCGLPGADLSNTNSTVEDLVLDPYLCTESMDAAVSDDSTGNKQSRKKHGRKKSVVEFSKVHPDKLPTVILVGRPNVGKSALFNRLIRRREALVYNTPDDHVTRDIREGIAKLGDLRFRVLDSAGLEMAASSGSILDRTAEMTGNVIARSQFAIFLIDVRDGLHPMDLEVGKWLRKHAPGVRTILAMNKSESLDDHRGYLTSAAGEAHKLGYGDPIAISAETGLGMVDLYESLLPLLEEYMLNAIDDKASEGSEFINAEESKLPLQLAIVGRPNVGKSTLLNALLQQDRVLVGPEVGLTRDSVRAQFQYQGRTIFLVDTAGWLQRSHQEKGPSSLSVMQSRKSLMRAHVIALVLDAEEVKWHAICSCCIKQLDT